MSHLTKQKYKLPVKYSELTWLQKKQVRELYVKRQKGNCMFCHKSLGKEAPYEVTKKKIDWNLFPKNFLNYPVHLQHNHETDLTEGAVHNYCNAVMWQYHQK